MERIAWELHLFAEKRRKFYPNICHHLTSVNVIVLSRLRNLEVDH